MSGQLVDIDRGCMESYPCQHYVTLVENDVTQTTVMCGDEILKKLLVGDVALREQWLEHFETYAQNRGEPLSVPPFTSPHDPTSMLCIIL